MPEDFPDPGEPWAHQEVTTPTDRMVQVMRISEEPKLRMIYAFRSQFGALTFTFTTMRRFRAALACITMPRSAATASWEG